MCEIAPFMIFDKRTPQQGNVGSNKYQIDSVMHANYIDDHKQYPTSLQQ